MKIEDLTVIVPTRNEARNIGPFLDSLPAGLPLIVVDASEDETPALILRRRPAHTETIIHPGHVTEARQIGAEAARTPWLLFTDADVVFSPDYFIRLRGLSDAESWYGPKLSRDAYQTYYRFQAAGQALCDRLGIPAASGSNLLVARRAFAAAGGFDLRLSCNEDSELAWRLKRRGFRVHYAPQMVVYAHDHRRLRRGVVRKTIHSLMRCSLLFAGLMPEAWRRSDWGYWAPLSRRRQLP